MPLGTLDRTPPPFFKQGPSALSKLLLLSALAVLLMATDNRFAVTKALRSVLVTALSPVQWLALQPVLWGEAVQKHFQTLEDAQFHAQAAIQQLTEQTARAGQVDQLLLENQRLRALLGLRERLRVDGRTAQVLYDAADPYAQRIVIDQGSTQGIEPGSPVLDESGILGQVTRVHPLVSEVTLLTDRDQAIPVLNTRTGVRSVAYGQAGTRGQELELRFMAGNADVQEGDVLSTSGVDGVYPAGLPVAKVTSVERRAESAFARVLCQPFSHADATLHVLVLPPTGAQQPPPPAPEVHRSGRRDAPPGRGSRPGSSH
ncbi:MAG TPA: rod shape-determining protein MreC [Burkholderiaceae bacterium]|nr:rod shape-determining protein MreC [Burkholderiaceae bacterium]